MNCTKCGTPLKPEDRFCYYCGAPVESPVTQPVPEQPVMPVTQPMTEQPIYNNPLLNGSIPSQSGFQQVGVQNVKSMSHNRGVSGRTVLGVLSIAVGCLIIVGIVMSLFIGGSYKSALKEMWYEVERQNTELAVACIFPEEAEGQIFTTTELMDRYIQELHTSAETRYGENYHINVKFDEVDKLDASELEQFNHWFENLALKDNVKKVYEVEYTRSIEGKKGRESEDFSCYIYRYNGNWYVLDTDLLGLQDPL